MSLVACPDCGKELSTEASACPSCGRPVRSAKSRGVFIILGLLLGGLGLHNFYAGYYKKGAAQLIITLTLGWVVVGLVITGIWALVEICTVTQDARGNPMA